MGASLAHAAAAGFEYVELRTAKGNSRPVATNLTAQGRKHNRRVELQLHLPVGHLRECDHSGMRGLPRGQVQ